MNTSSVIGGRNYSIENRTSVRQIETTQMYPQQQGYPQQPGYPPQGGYGYPQQPGMGYPQPGFQQPMGPSVNLNMGPQAGGYGGGGGSAGWPEPTGLFGEKAIRQAFVSKVYSILTVQLVFTSILIGAFVLNADVKLHFARSQGWMFLGFGLFIVSYLILVCVESARRSTPLNFIMLSILTLGYGLVAAITSCRYDTKIVMFAFIATGVSCFLIAALARSASFDMTNCGTTLCLLGLAHMLIGLVMVGLVAAGVIHASIGSLILSIGGALLASLYLLYDLQLIMGGRKCELSPEEYILGAIMLYTDIIQIFIYLLEIINRADD